ncbi:hypothetical protein DVH26_22950 [Paenibacillus sp. H1-7]|uniref:hypothetical protein n=1 Tax=Paenibacillus sp. H1-7 TaxID=2282849 RepID=UPI001EF857F3|nr:hypothetical protein [Paenibacillus sp. H1-7]ULL17046.1 hypothetical protein DVH26_22950 [Paenibacillus sp. H1-7]
MIRGIIYMVLLILFVAGLAVYYLKLFPKTKTKGLLLEKEIETFQGMNGNKVTVVYLTFLCQQGEKRLQLLDPADADQYIEGDRGELIYRGGFVLSFTPEKPPRIER